MAKRPTSKPGGDKNTTRKSAASRPARPRGAQGRPGTAAGNASAKRAKVGSAKRPINRMLAGKTSPQSKPVRSLRSEDAPVPPKPIKSPLSKKDLTFFREMLLAKRAMLVGDVTKMTDEALRKSRQSSTGDLSNMPIHMADLGSDNFEQEFTLGLIESEHQILREINEALTRIENGTYGICLATSKPISKARLKAKPWAKFCIEHAQRLERGY